MDILPLGSKDKCVEPGDELPDTQVPHHHFLAKEQEWAAETDGSLHVNDPVCLKCSSYKEMTHVRDVWLAAVSDSRCWRKGLHSTLANIPGHAQVVLFTLGHSLGIHTTASATERVYVLASQAPTENRPPPRLHASPAK